MPALSVIMLTYNREKFVARAIDCIIHQTLTDYEFIIIDNGSSDKSGEIAEGYAKKDSRISVIHRIRGNIGSGRNAGLDVAKSEYVTFIDDDDYCTNDFLEFIYKLAIENNADVSICGTEDKVFDEKIIMSAEKALVELMWRKRFNMAFPTKLFKRELINNLRFPTQGVYDDIALMYKILALANRVAYHGLPKYTFYRHDGNTSAWTTNYTLLTPETLDEYLSEYRKRTSWLSERFPEYASTWQYFNWSFMLSMVEKIILLDIKGCESQKVTMVHELNENKEIFLNSGLALDFEKTRMNHYILGVAN